MMAGFRVPVGAWWLAAGRLLLGQDELPGGCHLKAIFFLPVQDYDHALTTQ